ncbi:hypothetical protein PQG22_11565 [Aquirufa beregesia]
MNAKNQDLTIEKPSSEKKNWISPEINPWLTEQIELGFGPGGDGAGKSYD